MENEYIKDFDNWNTLKKSMDSKIMPIDFFFLEREIWWASIGINIREEIDGKHDNFERPILILKKINENTLWALPITSTEIESGKSHKLIYRKIKGFVSLIQLRYISSNRLLRLIMRLDEKEFASIVDKIMRLLAETIPPSLINQ